MVAGKTLQLNDGTSQGRAFLRSQVMRLQTVLNKVGNNLVLDGQYGKGTQVAVAKWQKAKGINEPVGVGPLTWASLSDAYAAAFGAADQLLASQLPGFHGDLQFVHLFEGHIGKPYWPKGKSGVTLDPGFDLGYVDPKALKDLYGSFIQGGQWAAVQKVLGLKGEAAGAALAKDTVLQGIRISRTQADNIMPFAAKPYWLAISQRFPSILAPTTFGTVQTVMLSLAYNRGPQNKNLAVLTTPLEAQDWAGVANLVGAMQQDHELVGLRSRRQDEASLIRWELGLG